MRAAWSEWRTTIGRSRSFGYSATRAASAASSPVKLARFKCLYSSSLVRSIALTGCSKLAAMLKRQLPTEGSLNTQSLAAQTPLSCSNCNVWRLFEQRGVVINRELTHSYPQDSMSFALHFTEFCLKVKSTVLFCFKSTELLHSSLNTLTTCRL